jgi:hypothetical protein
MRAFQMVFNRLYSMIYTWDWWRFSKRSVWGCCYRGLSSNVEKKDFSDILGLITS